MANSPESSHYNNSVDFRAPPPSPVAAGRRSFVANDEVLTEFLQHSLRVPDLVLPDRVFPRQKSIQNPPLLDFEVLNLSNSEPIAEILESIGRIGCFELINHGIPSDLIRSVMNSGSGIFALRPEQKAEILRSNERSYGFVEFHGGEETETSEEFVWRREKGLELEMEGIWPNGYSNFSVKMEMLLLEIEKVAEKIMHSVKQRFGRKSIFEGDIIPEEETDGSVCYLYKHCHNVDEESSNSLRYDVLRMLIRGSESPHSLCLHLCNGSSGFHVYSKKGWVSFIPHRDALIITIGDQLQAWSGGQYKHVIGRPIFKGEEDCISMAFLYSPPPQSSIISNSVFKEANGNYNISLVHQLMLVLILTLFYNLWVYLSSKS